MNEWAGRQPAKYPGINSELYLFSGQKYKFQAQQRKHFNLIETCYFVFVFSKRYCFHYSLGYFFSLVVKLSLTLSSLSLSPLSLYLYLSLYLIYISILLSLYPLFFSTFDENDIGAFKMQNKLGLFSIFLKLR